MTTTRALWSILENHSLVHHNPGRTQMIQDSLRKKEAMLAPHGALVCWTPVESTGRSPKDTVIVKRPASEDTIDWDSPNNIAISEQCFDMLYQDALTALAAQDELYVLERAVGADPDWALPVHTITDKALHALFADNMFRPMNGAKQNSIFRAEPFVLLALPYDKLEPERYAGQLRTLPNSNKTANMAVAMDLDRRIGIVYGSAYCGSMKKLIFTVANYYLPAKGILPLHCSANQGPTGDIALLLGLSGTGKTTLSADKRRALLGDDEHGWSENGIANFEYGCYAKLIDLDPDKEPEIFQAVFHEAPAEEHGVIIENTMMYPDGSFDLCDARLTPNSRASYPLRYLANIKEPPVGGHPKTVLFLTADANGVLPPVAKLSHTQAMLWFLMGYTSKLAGTETGIVEPKTVFSRFFGEPFMPRNPDEYAKMLGQKLQEHSTKVFLINTGWTGGPYGKGKRMDIRLTKEMVQAALSGGLDEVEYEEDSLFHLQVPLSCPGISDASILQPRSTWSDGSAYDKRAKKLAAEFSAHFDKAYGSKRISDTVKAQCPGK